MINTGTLDLATQQAVHEARLWQMRLGYMKTYTVRHVHVCVIRVVRGDVDQRRQHLTRKLSRTSVFQNFEHFA